MAVIVQYEPNLMAVIVQYAIDVHISSRYHPQQAPVILMSDKPSCPGIFHMN